MAPVSSRMVNIIEPRSPYGTAGLRREIQMVSLTSIESVFRRPALFFMKCSKFGLPISSSSSQMKSMFSGIPSWAE